MLQYEAKNKIKLDYFVKFIFLWDLLVHSFSAKIISLNYNGYPKNSLNKGLMKVLQIFTTHVLSS